MQILQNEKKLDEKLGKRKKRILSIPRFKNETQNVASENDVVAFLVHNVNLQDYDFILSDEPSYVSKDISELDLLDSNVLDDLIIDDFDDTQNIKKNYQLKDLTLVPKLKQALQGYNLIYLNPEKIADVNNIPESSEDQLINKLESSKNHKFITENVKTKNDKSGKGTDYLVDVEEAYVVLGGLI